jgi:pimeloyl-ACP methyl ester carboxylesterase
MVKRYSGIRSLSQAITSFVGRLQAPHPSIARALRNAGLWNMPELGRSTTPRSAVLPPPVILAGAILASIMGLPMSADAQSFESLRTPDSPLVLQALGSFYVGGRTVSQTAAEIGLYGRGTLVVDQMYVQYMIPKGHPKPSVVMIHGGTLSGKSYETTPDGRMGWYEYFTRRGYPSYLVDQVSRARSGFNQAAYNDVRAGIAVPNSQPNIRRVATDIAWVRFRIGPASGVPFRDTQFPVEAAGELAKEGVPDLSDGLPADNPNYQPLSDLAKKLQRAVLIGHSQGGRFPFEAALLSAEGIKGLVAIEPAGCNSTVYSDEQIANLSKVPILVVFGDHLDADQSVGMSWNEAFDDCKAFVARMNAAKGNASMLHTVELGIHGNSHMIMQDRNNLQIADLIMKWIEQHSRPAK